MGSAFDMTGRMKEEAEYITSHSEYSEEEALESLERGYRYFKDCGHDDEESMDKAVEVVTMATYRAGEMGFNLRGAVDQMLFSVNHRVQGGCGM